MQGNNEQQQQSTANDDIGIVNDTAVEDSTDKGKTSDPSDALTPDSPRFKEVYAKWKNADREIKKLNDSLSSRDSDIQMMKEHNQRLAESIDSLKNTVESSAEEPPPDFSENPEAYNQWWQEKFNKETEKIQEKFKQERFNDQVEDQRTIHDDYDAVIKSCMSEIQSDQSLNDRIFKSSNPARAAYKYGKAKMEKETKEKEPADNVDETEKLDAIAKGKVEGSGTTPGKSDNSKVKLTPEQARVAKFMGISEQKYAEQLKFMS